MKTTIIGLLAATAAAIQGIVQQGHDVTDWKTWILPVTLAVLGYLTADASTVKAGQITSAENRDAINKNSAKIANPQLPKIDPP